MKRIFVIITFVSLLFIDTGAQTRGSTKSSGTSGTPTIATKIIKETDRIRRASISVSYPQISGSAAATNFNLAVEQLVKRHVTDFKREDCDAEMYCEFGITFRAVHIDSRLVSIDFAADSNFWGAHPSSYSFVFNYDLKEKRQMNLWDLFNSNSRYLQTISNFCIGQLRRKLSDYDSLRDGAAPTIDNYDDWLIKRNGIQINFDTYQVASYAEGPQTVLVPYSVLKQQIAMGSPISHLVK